MDTGAAISIQDDAMTYRFSHGAPDRRLRGEINPRFLDAAGIRQSLLLLHPSFHTVIFPLAHIYRTEAIRCRDVVEKLDALCTALPGERQYAVELHNDEYLLPQYFECLAHHGVSHVLHDSTTMPSLLEQIQWPAALTSERVIVCSTASTYPEWQLGILETIRRCISERKELAVYLTDSDHCSVERALHSLVELLSPDLAKLSPLRRKAA
jgi:hypothetical protein